MSCLKILLLLICAMPSLSKASYRLTHYNIKELDALKVFALNQDSQALAATEVIKRTHADIVSLNEVQYELPGIPNSSIQTEGESLNRIGKAVFGKERFHSVFVPANTGNEAKPKLDGTYYRNSRFPDWKLFADHGNFGMFPHQYSNGLLSKYKIVAKKVFRDILWRDFNPTFDPSAFKDARGKAYPHDLALFDKSFTHVTLEIEGRRLHIILLHTVPAFNFGNPEGLNVPRNRDQLKFLHYYLTGKNPYPNKLEVKPLSPLDRIKVRRSHGTQRDHRQLPNLAPWPHHYL